MQTRRYCYLLWTCGKLDANSEMKKIINRNQLDRFPSMMNRCRTLTAEWMWKSDDNSWIRVDYVRIQERNIVCAIDTTPHTVGEKQNDVHFECQTFVLDLFASHSLSLSPLPPSSVSNSFELKISISDVLILFCHRYDLFFYCSYVGITLIDFPWNTYKTSE